MGTPKERVTSNIDRKLRIEADKKANELGISRAKFIEIALESELGRFNVHKENKRLTEAKNKAEQETEVVREKLATAEAEHKDKCGRLESEITELTELRDEVYESLNTEIDKVKVSEENLKQIASHLGVPDTVEHCKQRIDELEVSIQDKKKERDCFKAKSEEAQAKFNTCNEKLTRLLTRTWWERLWNTLPWVE